MMNYCNIEQESLSNQKIHTTLFTSEKITHNRHTNPFELLYNDPKRYFFHINGHKALKWKLNNYRPD